MNTFGEALVTIVFAIFCIAVLVTASADWDAPLHVEGFE